ncbi:unnamed protein product [Closterium sp. NIES-53]
MLNNIRKLGTPGRTTHEAAGPTGSHGVAAAAGAGYHQSLHAAQLHLDHHHRRRHLHRRGRCLLHLHSSATSTSAAATSTTAASTAAAATEAPTPATTPTSTATPSASSTTSTAAPTVPSTTLAPLALAVAAPPTRSRRSLNLLSANEVDSSSRSNSGEKGDRGTPLKERGARVPTRSSHS